MFSSPFNNIHPLRHIYPYLLLLALSLFVGACSDTGGGEEEVLNIDSIFIGSQSLDLSQSSFDEMPIDLTLDIIFSAPVNVSTANQSITLSYSGIPLDISTNFSNDNQNLRLRSNTSLPYNSDIILNISSDLKSADGGVFSGRQWTFTTVNGELEVTNFTIDGQSYNAFDYLSNISVNPEIVIEFSLPVDVSTLESELRLKGNDIPDFDIEVMNDDKEIVIHLSDNLASWTRYIFALEDGIQGRNGEIFESIQQEFYTRVDDTPKFPTISDEELLTLIQSQTFKYFWDYGHPVSGMARERNSNGNTVTSGGSGFGLMAMIVGVERGFITRSEAIERWKKIFDFLENADRFHGAWSHWLDGNTGVVRPFSQRDNGGDIVETAFLVQGMLTVRQYLDENDTEELDLINQIIRLWEGVEWDWYVRAGEEVITWHWSPEYEWAINLKVRGHNETQIIYTLAAASPTHTITPEIYHNGYARSGNMVNGSTFYGYELPIGQDRGGPLFFTHYSYLGMDPRNLKDQYADYWEQNVNHSLINRAYCIDNPKNFIGYSEDCWGLTASDNDQGYSAHSPDNDRGVITPTAAISSLPYTPEESMDAIRHFYYILGDKLWGEYGFYDAFNPTAGWFASSYIAIDQGPIVCMIENYRTGLLWDLYMSAPEVKAGLDKLGFTY